MKNVFFIIFFIVSLLFFNKVFAGSELEVKYEWGSNQNLVVTWNKVDNAVNYKISVVGINGYIEENTTPGFVYSTSQFNKDTIMSINIQAISKDGNVISERVITDFSSATGTGKKPGPAHGGSFGEIGPIKIPDFTGGLNIGGVFKIIINILLDFITVIAVIGIILSGYKYITSSGNPEEIASAKNSLLWSIIGLIIIWSSYAIIYFVAKSIGASN